MRNRIFSLLIYLVMAVALAVCPASGQQTVPPKPLPLTKIEIEGLQQQDLAQVLEASGLQKGQEVDLEGIKAAAKRLTETELFTKVAYRYRFSEQSIEVTFVVEELKKAGLPCVFDNFVWFSDEEIKEAIGRVVPGFDGTAPQTDFVIEKIKSALTRLLESRKIAGEVTYIIDENMVRGRTEHFFSIKGADVKVCEVQIANANEALKSELLAAFQPYVDREYSRQEAYLFVYAALLPIYRQHGYLKARFLDAQAKLGSDGKCRNGVSIVVPVEEGLQYYWDKATWLDNEVLSTKELDGAMKMKAGEVANLIQIEAAWRAIGNTYAKQGYLRAHLKPSPIFDDAQRRVSYQVTINEGPQYRMGQLKITGLSSEADVKRLKERWKLQPGVVFDDSYLEEFMSKTIKESGIKPGPEVKNVTTDRQLDHQKLIVDVVIQFKP